MTLFYNLNILINQVQHFYLLLQLHKGFPISAVSGRPLTFTSLTLEFLFTNLPFCLPEGAMLHMVQWMDEPLTKCLVRLAGQLEHPEPSFHAASIIQHMIDHGNSHRINCALKEAYGCLEGN